MTLPKNKNNSVRRWAALSAIGIEMGVIIYLFVKLGMWLDQMYNPDGKAFTVICTLAGVGGSLFLVVKQTNKLNS
jgi:hypothetical protein